MSINITLIYQHECKIGMNENEKSFIAGAEYKGTFTFGATTQEHLLLQPSMRKLQFAKVYVVQ